MGGEGHVFDMIRRTKQNRKMLQERRDRMKDLVEKMNGVSEQVGGRGNGTNRKRHKIERT